MDNRNVLVLDIVYDNFANIGLAEKVSVPKEEEVATLEGGLHGAGKNDDDGRGRVGNHGKTFPHLQVKFSKVSGQGGEQRTIKAVDRMRPKLRSWAAACRGFLRLESMVTVEARLFGLLTSDLRAGRRHGVRCSRIGMDSLEAARDKA